MGSEAMLIWMKYPAWSMISVSGAVMTISGPPSLTGAVVSESVALTNHPRAVQPRPGIVMETPHILMP